MYYKILESNGTDIEIADGGAFNNLSAGGKSGIVAGVLNECGITSVGNTLSIGTGLLLLNGIRVKIISPKDFSFSGIPSTAINYILVASVTLSSDSGTTFSLRATTEQSIIQDNLYKDERGVFELKIARFTHDTTGRIVDIARVCEVLTNISASTQGGSGLTKEEKEKVEKIKIDGDGTKYLADDGTYKTITSGGGSGNVPIDNELNADSENALQNKVITAELENRYTKENTYNRNEIDKKIGEVATNGQVDLTNYYNKQETNEKLAKKQDTLTAGDNITITPDGVISAVGGSIADAFRHNVVLSNVYPIGTSSQYAINLTMIVDIHRESPLTSLGELLSYQENAVIESVGGTAVGTTRLADLQIKSVEINETYLKIITQSSLKYQVVLPLAKYKHGLKINYTAKTEPFNSASVTIPFYTNTADTITDISQLKDYYNVLFLYDNSVGTNKWFKLFSYDSIVLIDEETQVVAEINSIEEEYVTEVQTDLLDSLYGDFVVDKTLSIPGAVAEAKAVGEAIEEVRGKIVAGATITDTQFVGEDSKGGYVYKQTFSNGYTAEFTAPQGKQGIQGKQGEQGIQGKQGEKGEAGVSFKIGAVTTGAPDTEAQAVNKGTPSDVVLDLVIPQGKQGERGLTYATYEHYCRLTESYSPTEKDRRYEISIVNANSSLTQYELWQHIYNTGARINRTDVSNPIYEGCSYKGFYAGYQVSDNGDIEDSFIYHGETIMRNLECVMTSVVANGETISAIELDKTLTKENFGADAKAVGDRFTQAEQKTALLYDILNQASITAVAEDVENNQEIRQTAQDGTTALTVVNGSKTTVTRIDGNSAFVDGVLKNAKINGIKSIGKNIVPYPYLDIAPNGTKTINGITFTDNGDGSITVNGTSTGYCSLFLAEKTPLSIGQYAISGGSTNVTFVVRRNTITENDINWATSQGEVTNRTWTETDVEINYMSLYIQPNKIVDNEIVYPMLQHGSATEYELYKENALTIPEVELAKYDYVDTATKQITRQTNALIFNGTENWIETESNISGGSRFILQFTQDESKFTEYTSLNAISNYYSITEYEQTTKGVGFDMNWVSVQNEEPYTLDEWKSYLSQLNTDGKPLQIIYKTNQSSQESIELSNEYTVYDGGTETILSPTDESGNNSFDYGAPPTVHNDYLIIVGEK